MMTMKMVVRNEAVVIANNPFAASVVADWIKFCDVKPCTQRTYDKSIASFVGYLKRNSIEQPQREDVIAYREWLLADGYKVSTSRLYLTVVKKFFRWLSSRSLYPNVAADVKLPELTTDEHAHDALSLEEARAAIFSFTGKSEKSLRDRAIMSLMIGCGLRSIEIVRLDIGDIEKRRGQWFIRVHGKARAGKTDSVALSPELKALIDEYMNARPVGKKGTPLFTSTANRNRGQRLQTQSISRLAKKVFAKIGIELDRVTCHSCRHTAATLMLEAHVDIRYVQKILRHRSVTTTEVYSHDIDRFKNNGVQVLSNLLFAA